MVLISTNICLIVSYDFAFCLVSLASITFFFILWCFLRSSCVLCYDGLCQTGCELVVLKFDVCNFAWVHPAEGWASDSDVVAFRCILKALATSILEAAPQSGSSYIFRVAWVAALHLAGHLISAYFLHLLFSLAFFFSIPARRSLCVNVPCFPSLHPSHGLQLICRFFFMCFLTDDVREDCKGFQGDWFEKCVRVFPC